MHVVVTQEHIDKARNLYKQAHFSMARSCPVALAVCDLFHLEPPAVCAFTKITLTRDGALQAFQANTPESVLAWMDQFDSGESVEPIEFNVPLYLVETNVY